MKFPFTASDKMVYAIDGVSKFMLHFIMGFRAELELPLFRQAVDLALTKSPILKSVARLKSFASYWEVVSDFTPDSILKVVDLSGDENQESRTPPLIEEYINEYIDITQTPPVQFLLIQLSPDRWTWVTKVHHCVLDPIGITHLVEDVQAYYAKLLKGEPIPSPVPMEDRGRWPIFKSVSPWLWGRVFWTGLRRVIQHRLERTKTVRCHVQFSSTRPPGDRISYHSVTFQGEDYRLIRARVKSLGVTFTDAVITAFCHAVRRWNGTRERPDGMYSIILPADVRRYVRKQGKVPRIMSNYVGGTLITVPVNAVTTFEETTRHVAQRTRRIRDHHDGLRHNLALPLMTLIPARWLREKFRNFHARHPRQFGPTAIVAYLGKIDRLISVFPGGEITSVEGIGTGFYPVGFDVVVVSYGKTYSVTFTYLKEACSDKEIEQFIQLFSQEVLQHGDKGASPRVGIDSEVSVGAH